MVTIAVWHRLGEYEVAHVLNNYKFIGFLENVDYNKLIYAIPVPIQNRLALW